MTESREQGPRRGEIDALTRVYERTRGETPPPHVDAKVLSHARQAVALPRRPRRWWIPVSVAASALLAVSLVMRIGHEAGPVPADRGSLEPGVTGTGPATAGYAGPAGRRAAELPQPDAAAEAAPTVAADTTRMAEPQQAVEADGPGPVLESSPAAAVPATASAGESRLEATAAAPTQKSAAGMRSAEPVPAPDAWFERIGRLEAEGRLEEAAAERKALEAAYPGWLAEHRKDSQ